MMDGTPTPAFGHGGQPPTPQTEVPTDRGANTMLAELMEQMRTMQDQFYATSRNPIVNLDLQHLMDQLTSRVPIESEDESDAEKSNPTANSAATKDESGLDKSSGPDTKSSDPDARTARCDTCGRRHGGVCFDEYPDLAPDWWTTRDADAFEPP